MFQEGDIVYCINDDIIKKYNRNKFIIKSIFHYYQDNIPIFEYLILDIISDEDTELFYFQDFLTLEEHRKLLLKKIKTNII